MTDEFRWAAVAKDPDEVLPVELGLFGLCANFWVANEEYQVGDIVWPIVETDAGEISGNGYCYECTTGGRSGNLQPRWNIVADQLLGKRDGSVQWTCRVAGSGGISAVSGPQAFPPDGINVTGLIVNENMKLFVDYADGILGEDHEVKFTFIIGGRVRVGRQTVQVRQK